MNDLEKFEETESQAFQRRKYLYIKEQYNESMDKLKQCIPLLDVAFAVKKIWDNDELTRECQIVYNNGWNWATEGIDIRIKLGPLDKVRDAAKALRPLKFGGMVDYVEPKVNDEAGWVGAIYRSKTSSRQIELKIYVAASKSCRKVKVGTKTVEEDVYKVVCDNEDEIQKNLEEAKNENLSLVQENVSSQETRELQAMGDDEGGR